MPVIEIIQKGSRASTPKAILYKVGSIRRDIKNDLVKAKKL